MSQISSLTVVLIKPSKYDDDGYVMRYWRGVLPSNTLACMIALTRTVADRWMKRDLPKIDVISVDDTVESIPYRKIARMNSQSCKVVAVRPSLPYGYRRKGIEKLCQRFYVVLAYFFPRDNFDIAEILIQNTVDPGRYHNDLFHDRNFRRKDGNIP